MKLRGVTTKYKVYFFTMQTFKELTFRIFDGKFLQMFQI